MIKNIIEEDYAQEIPVFIEVKPEFISKLAGLIARPDSKIMIGIAGESASGKSYLRKSIAEITDSHNGHALIMMDDYYKDLGEIVAGYGGKSAFLESTNYNFDEPEALDLALMQEHLLDLKAGKSVSVPRCYHDTCSRIENYRTVEPSRINIVDGIFCLNPQIREVIDIGIYVRADREEIKKRWYERASRRGVAGRAADIQYETVIGEARKYIIPTKEFADAIINGQASEQSFKYVFSRIFQLMNYNEQAMLN